MNFITQIVSFRGEKGALRVFIEYIWQLMDIIQLGPECLLSQENQWTLCENQVC